jgi:hypothetical protein
VTAPVFGSTVSFRSPGQPLGALVEIADREVLRNDDVVDDLLHSILGNGFLPLGCANDIYDDVASLHQLLDVFEPLSIRDFDPCFDCLVLAVLSRFVRFLASTTMTASCFSVSPLSASTMVSLG